MLLFCSACSDSDIGPNPSRQAKRHVTLTFSPGQARTRTAADEFRIDDINLYLFPTGGGPARHLHLSSQRSVVLELPEGDYALYAVANAGADMGGQIPVHCIMDEWPNVALPDDFDKLLATMRSRAISCSIIIQNIAQMKALFKDSWESLIGNCDEFLYLGGNEKEGHKYVSELLGKETLDTNTYGQTKGRGGSYSVNFQQSGRDVPYLFVKSSVALNLS